MVHMVAERDTDSVAPTPTPQHPHHSQHHHLSLHEIRALQVFNNFLLIFFSFINVKKSYHCNYIKLKYKKMKLNFLNLFKKIYSCSRFII